MERTASEEVVQGLAHSLPALLYALKSVNNNKKADFVVMRFIIKLCYTSIQHSDIVGLHECRMYFGFKLNCLIDEFLSFDVRILWINIMP